MIISDIFMDRVQIKNFKSLKNIDITLSNLTLITGVNSSGKSSFIQALLLLKENEDNLETVQEKSLTINGNYIKLGNKKDILFQDAYNEIIEISIFFQNQYTTLSFNNNDLKINLDTNVSAEYDYSFLYLYSVFSSSF